MKWWAQQQGGFVVPTAIPTRKQRKDGNTTVSTFYGVPVESERVVFVIDQSGSMAALGDTKDKLGPAVRETLKVIAKMRDGSKVNVVFFGTKVHTWSDNLRELGKNSRRELAEHLNRQKPLGDTNLYGGLELALSMDGVDTIYLLSDGEPSSGRFVVDEEILREIGKRNKRLRVQIHCISLDEDSPLLKKLAEQSGGTYVAR